MVDFLSILQTNGVAIRDVTNMLTFVESIIPNRIKSLLRGLPSRWRNMEHNRAIWNRYANTWDKKRVLVQNPDVGEHDRSAYLRYLGDEWGRRSDVDKIVEEYIHPYITNDSVVAEIGVGGGRIASMVAGKVKELYALDISKEMLRTARIALAQYPNVRYHLLHNPVLPDSLVGRCDFIYSFDVFVHLDLHTMWKYFVQIHGALQVGGRAFIHTTNLMAPGGWEHFSNQDEFSVMGQYPISPEIIGILAEHSGLSITKTSTPDPTNFYLNRDYLVIVEKRA